MTFKRSGTGLKQSKTPSTQGDSDTLTFAQIILLELTKRRLADHAWIDTRVAADRDDRIDVHFTSRTHVMGASRVKRIVDSTPSPHKALDSHASSSTRS